MAVNFDTSGVTENVIINLNDDGISNMFKRKVVLTNAQIKALPTIPVEIVPAPGIGKMNLYHHALLSSKFSGGIAYANAILPYLAIIYSSDWVRDAGAQMTSITAAPFLQNTIPQILTTPSVARVQGEYIASSTLTSTSAIENVGLFIIGGKEGGGAVGDWLGGHVNNTLEVTVFYSVVNL